MKAHQPHDPLLVVAMSPNYQQDKTLLAATDYLTVSIGVYLPLISTDGGNTLSPVRGVPNQPINSIQFSPNYAADNLVFMGGQAGLFVSTDKGFNWTQVQVDSGAAINSIAFSPNFANDATLFLITPTSVYKSSNRGRTFTSIPAPSPLTGNLTVIATSPNLTIDRTLLLGTQKDGIFRSTNGGTAWTNVAAGLPQVNALVFSPAFADDHTVFAGTYGAGVYISTTNGASFAASNSGITDLNVTSLITYPGYQHNGTVIVSTAKAGIFVSTTRGSSWIKGANVYRNLSNQTEQHYRTLAAAQASSNSVTIFLGMFEGFWTSTDRAQSWDYVDMLPTYLLRELKISANYPTDHVVLGTSYGGGQLFSNDGGTTWSLRNTGSDNSYPDADAISPNYPTDQTLAVGELQGLELSTNSGASWSRVPGLGATSYVRGLAISPNFAQDHVMLIGTDNRGTNNPPTVTYQGQVYNNQGLFLSTDGGVDWVPTSLSGPNIVNIAISPNFAADQIALAASSNSGLFQSKDGGKTWTSVLNLASDPGILQVDISPAFATDHTTFASTPHSGIYKSTDGGTTWAPLPRSTGYTALNFAISPNFATDQTIFIGTFQSGLIVTKDGGNTYQQTSLTQNFITGLDISSGFVNDHTLFAATYRGVFKSVDSGTTWTFTNQPNRQENDRLVNLIYAGDWNNVSNPKASTSSYQTTTAPGSTATITFFGTAYSLLSLVGPHSGTVSVTLDGAVVADNVSLFAPQTAYLQVIYQQSGLPCTNHTVILTSTAASGTGINYDAIDSSRNGCGY